MVKVGSKAKTQNRNVSKMVAEKQSVSLIPNSNSLYPAGACLPVRGMLSVLWHLQLSHINLYLRELLRSFPPVRIQNPVYSICVLCAKPLLAGSHCLWICDISAFCSPLAVLTVDHSVVDLETIEALYENVRNDTLITIMELRTLR